MSTYVSIHATDREEAIGFHVVRWENPRTGRRYVSMVLDTGRDQVTVYVTPEQFDRFRATVGSVVVEEAQTTS